MSFSIEYSPLAICDLDRVYAEVMEASQSIETAIRYVDDLMDRVAEKKEYPKSGSPLYYESGFTGFYFVVFKAYMVFYHVEQNKMLVDRIVYGKRDYMRAIFRR